MRRGAALRWSFGGVLLFLTLPALGCSASSTVEHTPPDLVPVETVTFVREEIDVVWARLLERLPAAGLTVLEADPVERVIWVSVAADRPNDVIDCGRSRRTFEPPLGRVETFEYAAAARTYYKLATFQGAPVEAIRDIVLEATAAMRLSPRDFGTEVAVDVSYRMNTMITYDELGPFGATRGEPRTTTRETTFQTNKPGMGDEEIALCVSKGAIERRLLEAAG